ncbi:TolC family protein [Croceibacterium sp. TMG7-5b_MA50]|uniref:TolC family protein n=1 Tax=Croceibacterium sp. TMG7-5b_MA50 TaxID=3121290 RepID=UPI003221F887
MRCTAILGWLAVLACAGTARAQDIAPLPAPALVPGDASAVAPSGPLLLAEVLQSSARTAPQIIAALAQVRVAEGRALSAEGAFDTVFEVDGDARPLGYYEGAEVSARVTRPLTDNGGYVYGGYDVSRGRFAPYYGNYYTDKLGELSIGGLFSLLRDRMVDERRTQRTLAASGIDIARFERELTALGVQFRAVSAYQDWVATGLRLRAYQDLLDLAESRRGAIVRQVELGARPEILLTENDQNLVRRRALVTQARGEFAAAAAALSLYYRDNAGQPLVVAADRLPADATALAGVAAADADWAQSRPELQVLLAEIDQANARLALAENDLRPRLDLRGDLSQDFGAQSLGGPSYGELEAIVGFRFSFPLQNRAARGRVDQALAEIDALEARGRYLRDQIAVEVRGITVRVDAARQLAGIAAEERRLAERLAQAERRRFELGSSDFFLVNQREETATDAQVRLIDAQARIATARAELAAAVADREALGLVP